MLSEVLESQIESSFPRKRAARVKAKPFVYQSVGQATGQPVGHPSGAASGNGNGNGAMQDWHDAPDGLAEPPRAQMQHQAWEKGVADGRAQMAREAEAIIEQERRAVAKLVGEFAHERENYFRTVEPEVVRLALSIAQRILHREAQCDPLVLAGVARVALDKVAASSKIRFCIHPSRVDSWQDYFSHQKDLRVAPEIIADSSLEPDECFLETDLGKTEVSLHAQLQEVERGLFDLLNHRPGTTQ